MADYHYINGNTALEMRDSQEAVTKTVGSDRDKEKRNLRQIFQGETTPESIPKLYSKLTEQLREIESTINQATESLWYQFINIATSSTYAEEREKLYEQLELLRKVFGPTERYEWVIQLMRLQNIYNFLNPKETEAFLRRHDYLIEPLTKANQILRNVLGDCLVEMGIEYRPDPEEDYDCIFIRTVARGITSQDGLKRRKEFYHRWWLEIDNRVIPLIGFSLRRI